MKHTKQIKPQLFDGMKQASVALGVDVVTLKWAKGEGCPSFEPGSRVRADVVEWLKLHPMPEGEGIESKELLERKRIEKQNRKLDFEHQVKLGQYVKIDDVKASWATAMEHIMDAMKGLMTREDYNAAIKQIRANIKGLDL